MWLFVQFLIMVNFARDNFVGRKHEYLHDCPHLPGYIVLPLPIFELKWHLILKWILDILGKKNPRKSRDTGKDKRFYHSVGSHPETEP